MFVCEIYWKLLLPLNSTEEVLVILQYAPLFLIPCSWDRTANLSCSAHCPVLIWCAVFQVQCPLWIDWGGGGWEVFCCTRQRTCTFTALHTVSALHGTHTSNCKASATFALSQSWVLTPGLTSPKTSVTLVLSLSLKTNSRHFSSSNTLTNQYSPSSLLLY